MENLKVENSTVDLRIENDVCKFQVAIVHRLGGVIGTDKHTEVLFVLYLFIIISVLYLFIIISVLYLFIIISVLYLFYY